MSRLCEAAGVESFEFHHMAVKPRLLLGREHVVVAFDVEVARTRSPIDIRVLAKPLCMLKDTGAVAAPGPLDTSEPTDSAAPVEAAARASCSGYLPPTSAPNSRR